VTDNPTPAWMEFVNFDGRITGETARLLKASAEVQGVTPQEMLDTILSNALSDGLHRDASGDVKVEPMTINAGNCGFHVVTVVADGYGNLIAEDQDGEQKATVDSARVHAEYEGKPEAAADLVTLMREFQKVAEKD